MTRDIRIIEDAIDLEDNRASGIDPFRRPRRVDEDAAMRASEPPFGEGTYTILCADCGFRFRSDDQYAALCPPCDKEDATENARGWEWHAYPYRRFRRGD